MAPATSKPFVIDLLLGLPWLYAVDALISIRDSSIRIGDSAVGEVPRDVRGPEMVFSPEHNLLMYPKAVLNNPGPVLDGNSDSSDEEQDESDE